VISLTISVYARLKERGVYTLSAQGTEFMVCRVDRTLYWCRSAPLSSIGAGAGPNSDARRETFALWHLPARNKSVVNTDRYLNIWLLFQNRKKDSMDSLYVVPSGHGPFQADHIVISQLHCVLDDLYLFRELPDSQVHDKDDSNANEPSETDEQYQILICHYIPPVLLF
jgi:hypothetical protein